MSRLRITIVGCGFTGLAIAAAVRTLFKEAEIIGHDKDNSKTQRAEKLKLIDKSNWNLPSACENAQLIVLAIPVDAIEPTLRAIAPDLIKGAIVTDTCSVKASLAEVVRKHLPPEAAYISSDIIFNPLRIAGDHSIEHISADLFKGAAWTLTPMAASPKQVDTFTSIVNATGAMPIFMDAVEHDGLRLAVDSIPAALGSAFMLAVTSDPAWRERQWLAGSTFGVATSNVESSQPSDIAHALVSQREASVFWLNQVANQLLVLRDYVEQERIDLIEAWISSAQDHREHWMGDWHRGRDQGAVPADVSRPNLMSMLVGSKLASRMSDTLNPLERRDKDKK